MSGIMITKKQGKSLLSAIYTAIANEESFIECHRVAYSKRSKTPTKIIPRDLMPPVLHARRTIASWRKIADSIKSQMELQ